MPPQNHLDELTAREREVLDLVRLGLTNEEIAGRLGITEAGAKYHVSQILSKLGVSTREEAAAVAIHAPTTHVAEAVQARRSRWWVALPLAAKAAGVAVMVAAVAGLAVLAWGVLRTSDGSEADDSDTAVETAKWTVEDARGFQGFELYWLGESYTGLPLTSILRYKYDDETHPLSAEDSARFIYGDCTPRPDQDGGCAVPLSLIVEPRCSKAALSSPDQIDSGEQTVVRQVPARYGEELLMIWTGEVVLTVFASGPGLPPSLEVAEAIRSLDSTTVAPGEPLPPPTLDPCPSLLDPIIPIP